LTTVGNEWTLYNFVGVGAKRHILLSSPGRRVFVYFWCKGCIFTTLPSLQPVKMQKN